MSAQRESSEGGWFLEGCVGGDTVPRRFSLKTMPARIGRSRKAEITLPLDNISGLHAEFFARADELWLRDLQSTNGTYCNGERVATAQRLEAGDVIHFAHSEFVLGRIETVRHDAGDEEAVTVLARGPVPAPVSHPARARALQDLLDTGAVVAHYQPLFDVTGHRLFGFEALGRGAHPALPESPAELFDLAARLDRSIELSEAFRDAALGELAELPGDTELFLNTHPGEIGTRELLDGVARMRERAGNRPVTLEVHEGTVSGSTREMRELRAALDDSGVRLAYDDFGAGQARLLELVEVPPDYLKFDISLVHDIDRAPDARRRLLQMLVRMTADLGIRCIAEGVERDEELEACRELGLDIIQGFLLGRPAPLSAWSTAAGNAREG